jgi:hypothetical protein
MHQPHNAWQYARLKQAGACVMGLGEMADHPVVLAKLGGAWRIGVLHPQFSEPDVGLGLSGRRRQRAPSQGPARSPRLLAA